MSKTVFSGRGPIAGAKSHLPVPRADHPQVRALSRSPAFLRTRSLRPGTGQPGGGLLASERQVTHFAGQRMNRPGKLASHPLRVRNFVFLFIAGALLATDWPAGGATVNVFAAASLTDTLKAISGAYAKQCADKIVFNFGASSTLARQIEEGAPADIFFSADEARMDLLQKRGLIEQATRRSRLSNALAIVVAAEAGVSILSPSDLLQPRVKRVAIGDARAVPVGVYAREYLDKQGLWQALQSKLVITENVRAALSAVEAGDADAGIVYKTDALISKKVKIAFLVPVAQGPKISYPMALVKDAKAPEAASKFLRYLESVEAGKVFEQYGFILAGQ